MERNNNLRQVRETQMLSKSELAKRAGISPLTIDRIEKGECHPGSRLDEKSYWVWDSNFRRDGGCLRKTKHGNLIEIF
jgi:hypothetical protein